MKGLHLRHLVALVLVLVTGCSQTEPAAAPGASDSDRAEFAVAQETWQSNASGYIMTYVSPCGQSASFTDVDTTVEVTEDGAATIVEGPNVTPLTVDFLFGQIGIALNEAEVVEVTYNDLGYPDVVNIDFEVNSIDDEFCATVSSLQLASR